MTDRQALIAEIRELASRGHSGGEIGAHLGLTRGAVAGLCSRNGIRLAGTIRSATVAADKPAQKPRKDRSGNGCLWPMWGDQERPTHVYCGQRRDQASPPYCAKHTARARGRTTGHGMVLPRS